MDGTQGERTESELQSLLFSGGFCQDWEKRAFFPARSGSRRRLKTRGPRQHGGQAIFTWLWRQDARPREERGLGSVLPARSTRSRQQDSETLLLCHLPCTTVARMRRATLSVASSHSVSDKNSRNADAGQERPSSRRCSTRSATVSGSLMSEKRTPALSTFPFSRNSMPVSR